MQYNAACFDGHNCVSATNCMHVLPTSGQVLSGMSHTSKLMPIINSDRRKFCFFKQDALSQYIQEVVNTFWQMISSLLASVTMVSSHHYCPACFPLSAKAHCHLRGEQQAPASAGLKSAIIAMHSSELLLSVSLCTSTLCKAAEKLMGT